MHIEEKLIQFIWQHQLFDFSDLKTIHGESIKIIKNGFLNDYDGPDFSDARIRISNIEWAGTVEIHVKDIDWMKHGHQSDEKYGSVVLHVVWEVQNQEAVPKDIPCLVLKDYVLPRFLRTYRELLDTSSQLSCDDHLSKINNLDKVYAIEEMSYERLRRKAAVSQEKLNGFGGDWQQLLLWMFALALGKKANKEGMTLLSEAVQMKYLQKHSDDLQSIEAILFGAAGLIEPDDDYGASLAKEYKFLGQKYELETLSANVWNFSKVRGGSRPHASVAILCAIVYSINQLNDIKALDSMFLKNIELTEYWQKHLKFGTLSKRKNTISKGLIEHLKINVIVPYLNILGRYYNDDLYFQRAQEILESIKAEQNAIVRKFVDRNFDIANSYQSQGAIELYNEYCKNKHCLDCQIGKKILNQV